MSSPLDPGHARGSMKSNTHGLRPLLVRAELASTQDQFLRRLSRAASDSALRGHAGLADRMAAAVGAAFAAAQRVVDRIHRLGTGVRANAHVTRATGLSDADVDPIEIPKLSDGRAAG